MDEPRVLLSRLLIIGNDKLDLPEPLFYYIAVGLTFAGIVALIASMIGWWAACLNTYCLLSIVSVLFTENALKTPSNDLIFLAVLFNRSNFINCGIWNMFNYNDVAAVFGIEFR